MANARIARFKGMIRGIGRFLANLVRRMTVRFYALAILLVVLWTGYTAVAFLVRSVFSPVLVPPQYLQRGTPLTADALKAEQLLAAVLPESRGTLGHFHQLDRWFQPDIQNGCSTSGCHSPLPHGKHKETRAFANFHTTFLTCAMCHDAGVRSPLQTTWVSMPDVDQQSPPAILQLMSLLDVEAAKLQSAPAEVHQRIVDLLKRSMSTAGDSGPLQYLLLQINTSEPGSPVWRRAVAELTTELPNCARGEYGAKLAPTADVESLQGQSRQLADLAAKYASSSPNSREREQLHKEIHASILAKPDACLSCHGGDPARVDFQALGYSPQRAAYLRGVPIAGLIQRNREGKPFYLPQLLEQNGGR